MTERKTKKVLFNEVLDYLKGNQELTNFIKNEIALVEKKNSAKKSPTKNQVENVSIKENILNTMATDKAYTVSEIIDLLGLGLTNQRVSALLTQLVNDGKVVRSVEKRKAYFTKA